MKYLGYARKSSESSERQVLSIDGQIGAIQEKFFELDIIDIETESKSAFKPYNRPCFQETLDRIERGEAQGLVAWHPNRLSRNEMDAARIVYLIRNHILQDLKFVTYTFEDSPEGIWMLQMQLSQSQYESAKLSREVLRGMTIKARAGQFPSRVPPGYLNSGPTSEKGTRYVYDDPSRLPLLAEIVKLGLTGNYTKAELHRKLAYEWGFKTRRTRRIGGKPLSYNQFDRMMRNIFYTGHFNFQGQLYKGRHTAIMTLAEYELLQRRFSRFGDERMRRQGKRDYVHFTGLIKCGTCGHAVTATEKRKYYKRTDREAIYLYYHCTHNSKSHVCHESAIPEGKLIAQFGEALHGYRILAVFRDLAIEYLRRKRDERAHENQRLIVSRQAELKNTRAKLDRLIDMRAGGELEDLDEADFKRRVATYKQQATALDRDIEEVEEFSEKTAHAAQEVFNLAAFAAVRFAEGTTEEKRQVLLSMFENLTLSDRKLVTKAKKWLKPLRDGYSDIEALYELSRTSNFGFTKDKLLLLVSIIQQWWTIVDAVVALVEEELRDGDIADNYSDVTRISPH